jgi:transposase
LLASLFDVAKNTVQNWLTLERQTGSVEPRAHAGGVPATISGRTLDTLCMMVGERNDATLKDLKESLEAECEIKTSPPAVCRALHKAGISRKRRRSMRTSATAPMS